MTPQTPSPTKRKKVTATCLRCGYEWPVRKPIREVKECPHCKSYKWREPIKPRRKARTA